MGVATLIHEDTPGSLTHSTFGYSVMSPSLMSNLDISCCLNLIWISKGLCVYYLPYCHGYYCNPQESKICRKQSLLSGNNGWLG
uniref:Uncharacterized protein n=1 Tax=Physcomitrium patens TaxID=3218 RepID=A0A2K1JIG0_PHYPA|nr:hypothetical protein PHYPA_018747 [Physcomitrium patens]